MRISLSAITVLCLVLAGAGPSLAGTSSDPCYDDGDTVPCYADNCMMVPNGVMDPVPQCDTDQDGYGNACDADVNNDGVIGIPDYAPVGYCIAMWPFPCYALGADVNCDGGVGTPDYAPIGANMGGVPGPSGLICAGTIPCP